MQADGKMQNKKIKNETVVLLFRRLKKASMNGTDWKVNLFGSKNKKERNENWLKVSKNKGKITLLFPTEKRQKYDRAGVEDEVRHLDKEANMINK